MERGRAISCTNRLIAMGFDEDHAKLICSVYLIEKDDEEDNKFKDRIRQLEEETKDMNDNEKEEYYRIHLIDEFSTGIVDQEGDRCVSRKIKIFKAEHPDWDHDHVVAAAIGWCKQRRQDAIIQTPEQKLTEEGVHTRNISLSRFKTVIKTIKSKKGMKVPGMGFLPLKTELPMKNLNRLQTKLEKLFTLEQRFLTLEELLKRARYMILMKKDSEVEETLGDYIYDFLTSVAEEYPIIKEEAFLKELIDEITERRDSYFIMENIQLQHFNDGLNNIIKKPVIMAREMIQQYENGKVKHFKPYDELKKAIAGITEMPIIIEHQDDITERNTVGWVKELRADDEIRGLKGTVYLTESKLPEPVLEHIRKGIVVPVSIGFFSKLGDGGTWNGQNYDYTQEDIILNHLAIIVNTVARCPTGYCGINLDSVDLDEKTIDDTQDTIISKDNYFINICKLLHDSNETIKIKITNQKVIEDKKMENDSFPDPKSGKIAGNEPEDLEAILTKLRKFMAGIPIEDAKVTMSRILNAFKDSIGENQMDEKEVKALEDSIAQKDSELEDLKKKIEDSEETIAEYKEKERKALADSIKTFTDKYTDEELDGMKKDKLEIIQDAITRFQPSMDKPDEVLPKGSKPEPKIREDSRKKFDTRRLHDDVNKEYDLSAVGEIRR